MDKFFQIFCNLFPAFKLNNKFKKKFFYIIFSIFKPFLKGPFIINFGNFKIFSYPAKGDYTRYMLTRASLPDPRERNIIIQNLKSKKNIFIDCGANVGFYSLDVATKVDNVSIYAFEPSKKERIFLKNNLDLNKINNTKIIELALGDKDGVAIFNDTRDNKLYNSSGGGFITSQVAVSKNNYKVKIVTLDNFFKDKNFSDKSSIFIKTDLEGYDIKAINGAKNLLLKYDCSVIFEFSKMIMKQSDYSIKDFDIFLNNGFKLFDMYGKKISCNDLETKIKGLDEDHDTCGNFILSKKNLNFSFK
tara:strand:+ start:1847 stop:2755 length:909 start_codon:yes stop_codon:yes gene_type:complete